MLVPVLRWIIARHRPDLPVEARVADFSRLRKPPRKLSDQIRVAVELYPCDVVFVHRDAERQPPADRREEIRVALQSLADFTTPHVCVVPRRMSEAWLLIDEAAIRSAAGNRNGTMKLALPPLAKLEDLPDPKALLHRLLEQASGLKGRHLDKFHPAQQVLSVAEYIEDYTPLRRLPEFRTLERDVRAFLDDWTPGE